MALSVRSTDRMTHCTIEVSISEYVNDRPEVNDPTDPAVATRYSETINMIATDKKSRRVANHRLAAQYVKYKFAFVSTTRRFCLVKSSSIRKARIVSRPDNVSLNRLYTGVLVIPSSRLISREDFLKYCPM
ncbi:unnamed protein product [Phytophthora lilii]|uniref:Unnamed protein product n=1 Tax=Phytophthora lilii TaxID=2077276 RepID=A0A9W7D3U0_9STRA|nr:unnamed protein product [Phytophthora lilii]